METNEKLLSSIFSIGRLIREKILESKSLADFTHLEIEILKFLHGKKNTTMKEISDYLRIKPSSATPVIDSLVKKGNLKRVKNSTDRRMLYITMTAKGNRNLQNKCKNIHKTIKNVFSPLSEKDKKELIKIFNKIDENNI